MVLTLEQPLTYLQGVLEERLGGTSLPWAWYRNARLFRLVARLVCPSGNSIVL